MTTPRLLDSNETKDAKVEKPKRTPRGKSLGISPSPSPSPSPTAAPILRESCYLLIAGHFYDTREYTSQGKIFIKQIIKALEPQMKVHIFDVFSEEKSKEIKLEEEVKVEGRTTASITLGKGIKFLDPRQVFDAVTEYKKRLPSALDQIAAMDAIEKETYRLRLEKSPEGLQTYFHRHPKAKELGLEAYLKTQAPFIIHFVEGNLGVYSEQDILIDLRKEATVDARLDPTHPMRNPNVFYIGKGRGHGKLKDMMLESRADFVPFNHIDNLPRFTNDMRAFFGLPPKLSRVASKENTTSPVTGSPQATSPLSSSSSAGSTSSPGSVAGSPQVVVTSPTSSTPSSSSSAGSTSSPDSVTGSLQVVTSPTSSTLGSSSAASPSSTRDSAYPVTSPFQTPTPSPGPFRPTSPFFLGKPPLGMFSRSNSDPDDDIGGVSIGVGIVVSVGSPPPPTPLNSSNSLSSGHKRLISISEELNEEDDNEEDDAEISNLTKGMRETAVGAGVGGSSGSASDENEPTPRPSSPVPGGRP